MATVQSQVRSYQAAHYSIHVMSRLLRCSRKLVRLMLAESWHHPQVQAYLYHARPTMDPAATVSVPVTPPVPRPRLTRVGYLESWQQHQEPSQTF